jgi:hypothetical protein
VVDGRGNPSTQEAISREVKIALIALAAIFVTQPAWIKRTNFAGFDEWFIIDLVAKGIVDVAYANRPVQLLWLLPANLARNSLTPYVALYGAYSFLSGALVFVLCRRLARDRPLLAMLTAVFSIVWAPGDLARLSTVDRALYTAFEFSTLLALLLLVESWRVRSIPLLACGTLMAFLAARSYEAVVPLLVFAPLLLLQVRREFGARFRSWVLAWEGVVALAVVHMALQHFLSKDLLAYQLQLLRLDLNPARIAMRLGIQYLYHVAPLVFSPLSELAAAAVPIAVSVFCVAVLAWTRLVRESAEGFADLSFHGWAMIAGLLWAGLGYSLLVLTPSQPTALRMQILSAPGIAVFLASLVSLASKPLPTRWRRAGIGVMGAWIVAVGTGRTLAMQSAWDGVSVYPRQIAMLKGLTREVPDVRPQTLLVLLDQGRAWRATYGFHHAVQYLYQGRAIGHVRGAWDALYPTFFTPEGIRIEPWPVVRAAWGARVWLKRYDETIVVRYMPEGEVEVLARWPDELPPLPPGERYDPGSRIVAGASPPPERAMLEKAPAR